ncbi:MAG: WhiB family transcriptional regulator [Actinobacteria bacterium]|nr:MAG: WhiB family transcriptional regulator [Actinomycetota bacterium]
MENTLELDLGALRPPVLEERPWAVFAACRDADSDLFFPTTKEQESQALAICGICPVIDDCLDLALDSAERFGVWGGTTERQRRRLLRDLA